MINEIMKRVYIVCRTGFSCIVIPMLFMACSQVGRIAEDKQQRYQPDRYPETTLDCVFIKTVFNWKALDGYRLIVWTSRNRAYLFELETECRRMKYVNSIGFSDWCGQICAANSSVIVHGIATERCSIGAIISLRQEDLTWLLNENK